MADPEDAIQELEDDMVRDFYALWWKCRREGGPAERIALLGTLADGLDKLLPHRRDWDEDVQSWAELATLAWRAEDWLRTDDTEDEAD